MQDLFYTRELINGIKIFERPFDKNMSKNIYAFNITSDSGMQHKRMIVFFFLSETGK